MKSGDQSTAGLDLTKFQVITLWQELVLSTDDPNQRSGNEKKNKVIKFNKEPKANPNRATTKTCCPFQKIEAIPGGKTSKIEDIETNSRIKKKTNNREKRDKP